MLKRMTSVVVLVFALILLVIPGQIQAANYEITTSLVGGTTVLNSGTNYTVSILVKNNTASAANLTVQWVNPQGVFLSGSVSLSNGVSVVGSTSLAGRVRNVWFTLPANSQTTVTHTLNGRDCIPNSGTFFGKLFSGHNSYGTLLASSNYSVTGGTGRVACALDTSYPVLTTMNRNTSYYEEVLFSIAYSTAQSGVLKYDVSNAGRSSFDAGDAAKLYYDPGSVFVADCTFDLVRDSATCSGSFWQSGKTGVIASWYTTNNIAGGDHKIVWFSKGGLLQFSEYIPVTYN